MFYIWIWQNAARFRRAIKGGVLGKYAQPFSDAFNFVGV
jgi:hypothetical protein